MRSPAGGGPEQLAGEFVGRCDGRHRPLIALDHDGTLAPIAPTPDAAALAEGAREAISALTDVADVAILSGRGLDDLSRRFAGLDVTLVSEHGLRERRPDGRLRQLATALPPGSLADVRAGLDALVDGRPGWLIEDKGVSIAVHHRLVPPDELEPTLGAVRAALEQAITGMGLDAVIQDGHAVLELRPRGADKGAALLRLVEERGTPPVLMVGDDLTDEPALALAEHHGGLGVLVSAAPRASSASAHLDDPAAVVVMLGEIAQRLARP
jgi:trehalose 6-phosphate phosphatase